MTAPLIITSALIVTAALTALLRRRAYQRRMAARLFEWDVWDRPREFQRKPSWVTSVPTRPLYPSSGEDYGDQS